MSLNLDNLQACTDDARRAALDGDTGPSDPTDFSQLRGRLEAAREKLPPLYRQEVFEPYVRKLDELGPFEFMRILLKDPFQNGLAGLMLDIAHAIIQNGEGYEERATDGFQEVVSDLYDGFLSAEDRRGVKPPDRGVIAPLVKWGNPDSGPYTWPVSATEIFDVGAAIVSLPPANARSGLLAWAVLGHETAGHDILHADTGLRAEIGQEVFQELTNEKLPSLFPRYWADRIDETASDVLGILNMGPSAAIGLVGYFRGLRAAFAGVPKLSNVGSAEGVHPADILRGFLGASTVRLLCFDGAQDAAKAIDQEVAKDVGNIVLEDLPVSEADARKSAEVVARTIVQSRMESLENRALGEIQNWRNQDEAIVAELRAVLRSANALPDHFAEGIYAAHAVAAAVTAALAKGGDIPLLFRRLLAVLKSMHDGNPSWGPLYVTRPSNILRHLVYEEGRARDLATDKQRSSAGPTKDEIPRQTGETVQTHAT